MYYTFMYVPVTNYIHVCACVCVPVLHTRRTYRVQGNKKVNLYLVWNVLYLFVFICTRYRVLVSIWISIRCYYIHVYMYMYVHVHVCI